MAGGALSAELTDINKLLDELDHRLPFVISPDELGAAMCDITAAQHRLKATATRLAQACTSNNVAPSSGQRTIGQYVASRTNSPAIETDRLVRTSKWLRDYPLFEAAYGRELTHAHIHYMRTKLDTTYSNHTALRDWQQFFIDTANTCGFTEFTQACNYWLIHIDPDGKEPTDQLVNSKLRLTTGPGGRVKISGECDAVTGQALRTALDHQSNKLRRDEDEAGVMRSAAQRRLAALTQLVTKGFERGDGSFPVPLVNIVMSASVAEWAMAALNGTLSESPTTVPVHHTDIDRRCELINGTPIHPFLAMHGLGLATGHSDPIKLRRLIMGADSRPIDVSVTARSFPEWMRTTSLIQSRGACATHGCDAPHSWIEIDHINPVANNGETRLDNAQPQCRPDNHAKSATVGHIPWRDRPPPPRHRQHHQSYSTRDSDDHDADNDSL